MKYYILLAIFACTCNQYPTGQPAYDVDHKLTTPMEFNGGNITTINGINFSKNGSELYISKYLEKRFDNGKRYLGIFKYTHKDKHWGEPERGLFGVDIDAYHPVLSADNLILFFNSRSHPDASGVAVPHKIWFSKKKVDAGWSLPC